MLKMRTVFYSALSLALLLFMMALPQTALAAYDADAIGDAAALKEALEASEPSITLSANIVSTETLMIPAGTTVYINGKVWSVGSGAVSGGGSINLTNGTLVTEAGASVTAAVTGTGEQRQARTVSVVGVGASETIASVTYADGASDSSAYVQKPLSGGAAVIYPLAADAGKAIRSLATDAGVYRLSNGSLARVYSIGYDLAGGTVAATNPVDYTSADAAFTLVNPTKQGFDFAGWTGTGLAVPTLSVTVPTGTAGTLNFTATWTQQTGPGGGTGGMGGFGGGAGGGSSAGTAGVVDASAAETETDETQTDAVSAAAPDSAAQSGGSGVRVSWASSATKVTFYDGSTPSASSILMGSADSAAKEKSPWPYIGLGALLLSGVVGFSVYGSRERKQSRAARDKK